MSAATARVQTVIDVLERTFGIPVPPRRKAPPLDMLIATVLSQNTNDLNSHRAYLALRKKYRAWADVECARRRDIARAIRIGGIADRKSRLIKKMLGTIRKRYGPSGLDSLRRLDNVQAMKELQMIDGVGTKTAACVLLFSLGRHLFPVDTHIHRICGRLGLTRDCKLPDQTFEQMNDRVPPGKAYSFHINLIRFGRTICRSERPLCGICPLFAACRFKRRHFFRKQAAASPTREANFMHLDHV